MSRAKVTLSLIFLAGLLTLPMTSCGRQTEGERCDPENGDQDCDSGLVCRLASELRNARQDMVDRCCPENKDDYNVSSCAPKTGGTGDGDGDGDMGGGGNGGAGGADNGTGGSDSGSEAGAPCNYTSDCKEPLVCGVTGQCQIECQTDRDCESGLECNDEGSCVPQ